jgi:hypothetical protein
MGGTFSGSLSIDLFRPDGIPCYLCLTDGLKKDVIERIMPEKIMELTSVEFLPKDNNPVGQSNTYLCSTCSDLMTSLFVNFTFGDESVKDPKR